MLAPFYLFRRRLGSRGEWNFGVVSLTKGAQNMHITVSFVGILAELIQKDSFGVYLPQQATYRDLLNEIWLHLGRSIPDPLWDRQANAFKEPIFAVAGCRTIESPDTPLADGEEVKFLTLIAGG